MRRHWLIWAAGLFALVCLTYAWIVMAPGGDPHISEADYHAWDERTGMLPVLAVVVGGTILTVGLVLCFIHGLAWLLERFLRPR